MRKKIIADNWVDSNAPYSLGIISNGPFLFIAGQVPVDQTTGKFCLGSFREQVITVFDNVSYLLKTAGTSWEHVVKVNVYLADYATFEEFNQIYMHYIVAPYPARTTVQVGLWQIGIEVDCIAALPQ